MQQRWTLHVENFARIKEADIEISPLMCFVGDNNSGKSYMMSLLWGLLVSGEVLSENATQALTTKKCEEWLSNNMGEPVDLNEDIQQMYIDWFNELIEFNKQSFIGYVFNQDIPIGKIEIRNFKRIRCFKIKIQNMSDRFEFSIIENGYINIFLGLDIPKINFLICWNLLMGNLGDINPFRKSRVEPVYFPSSRTGLLLTYRQLAANAIETVYSQNLSNNSQESLTLPYIKFLQKLSTLHHGQHLYSDEVKDLINFLERDLSNGKVKYLEDSQVIRYRPEDVGQDIPLSITSAVVTEISPFILLLKNNMIPLMFVVDEPEAHLHPILQKKIAQFIVRLMHYNTPVWITTHSDTILQHFNNMIKLKNHPDCEKLLEEFSYTKDDLLGEGEITLYQFKRKEHETSIERLNPGKYGFIVPTFNDANDKLLEEILAFQGDD